ncbi:MAG: ADOP family duplicated permease [Vicinamibacterales bacterium]
METLWQDARLALRSWRRRPMLAAVIVITLSLGLAALSLVATVVDDVLLAPLPFPDAGRLAVVRGALPGLGQPASALSGPEVEAVTTRARSLEVAGGVWARPGVIGRAETAAEIEVGWITPGFLEALGVQPRIGRLPTREEHLRTDVIVLGDELWRERFGGDPAIVGRRIDFDDEPRTVVGVMPRGFRMLFPPEDGVPESVQAWLPWGEDVGGMSRTFRVFTVVGRAASGASIATLDSELRAVAVGVATESVDYAKSGFALSPVPLDAALVAPVRATLLLLFGAVALVFVIAIANIANLLLIRSMERTSEFAMRMALGSGARRLWRQIITESALLGVAGAAFGLWLAYAGVAILHQLSPTGVPRLQDVAVDRVTLALAAATTVLSVLVLSWVAARQALSGTPLLQQSARGSSHRSRPAQQLLLVAQVSLSVILLCGAGLLARSVLLLNRVDLGFDPVNVVSVRLSLPDARYPYRTAGPAIGEFYRRLDERLAALPGVVAAGATLGPPLSDLPMRPKPYAYRVRGGEVEWGSLAADYRTVTPGWFTAVGARLVAGRVFDDRDRWDGPIAVVVDTALANRAWPGQDAIGQPVRVELFREGVFGPHWGQVVGVIDPIRLNSLVAAGREQVYVAHHQSPQRTMFPAVRAAGDPLALVGSVQAAVRSLEPDLPIFEVRLAGDYVAMATARTRLATIGLGLFAMLAVVLAAAGLFAAMGASVGRQRREIGIRLALGASPMTIFGWTLGRGLRVTAVGVGLGLAGAVALSRSLASLLFGVSPTDPLTLAAVSVLVTLVAAAACWRPAARAARVDPCQTLAEP